MKVRKSIVIKEEIWRELKSLAAKNGKTIPEQIKTFLEKEKQSFQTPSIKKEEMF